MELRITKKINKTTVVEAIFDDERDMKEAILKARFFEGIPHRCGKCGSENISPLSARKAKGKNGQEFIYVEAYCFDCKARRSTGEYLSPKGTLFWKQWQDPYVKKEGEETIILDEE